jgi:uncharacterized delta-60 repeat protein
VVARPVCIDLLESRVLLSGNLDTTFGTGGRVQGASGSGTGFLKATGCLQSDGKLLLLADTGASQSVYRFLANGALDTSFGTDGSLVVAATSDSGGETLLLAEAANGDIFAETSTGLSEISSSGVLNTGFQTANGFPTTAPTAMETDGNELVAASGSLIYELNPDGSLNTDFGSSGSVTLPDAVTSVVVTPAGKIAASINPASIYVHNIYQFNSDGSADTSFGQSGQVYGISGNQLLPQAGPSGQLYDYSDESGSPNITRLTATGASDSTFTTISLSSVEPVYAVEPDGSVIVTADQAAPLPIFTHYSSSGAELSTSGSINLPGISQVLPQADGSYIAVNNGGTGSATTAAEFTSANVPDESFGTGGLLTSFNTATTPTPYSIYSAVTLQSNRNVVVGNVLNGPNGQVMQLTRYNVNGSLDTSFGTNGSVEENFGSLQVQSLTLLTEPSGQIAAAGNLEDELVSTAPTAFGVAEFSANGALVSSFGTSGQVVFQGDQNPSLLWQDGELLVGSANTVRRLTSTGALDSSFPTSLQGGQAFAVQADDKILVAAETAGQPATTAVYRYNENGSVDTSFGTNGVASSTQVDPAQGSLGIEQMVAESSGTIVLMTSTASSYELLGLNANGTTDTAFGTNGTVSQSTYNLIGDVLSPPSLLQEPNGDLLSVIPQRASELDVQYAVIQDFLPAGQLNSSFATNGTDTIGSDVGVNSTIGDSGTVGSEAALDSTGRLLLAGGYLYVYAVDTTVGSTASTAAKLAFVNQPQASADGTLSSFTVEVEDSSGQVVTTNDSTITISLAGGSAGATLSGATTVTAVDGTATFQLNLPTPGTGYTLLASDESLTSATSASFNVAAKNLVFATQPTNSLTDQMLSPVVVKIDNADGTLASGDDSPVTLTVSNGSGSVSLAGTTTVAAENGVATFSNLMIAALGEGCTLTATDGQDTPATSALFSVGVPKLVFTQQPADATIIGTPGPVTVAIEDSSGNLITSDHSPVTLALAGATAGAQLNGTAVVNAVNGIATFSGFSVSTPGNGYILTATDGVDSANSSSSFDVTTPSQVSVAFAKVTPPATNIAGQKLNARASVVITNTQAAIRQKIGVRIFASTTTDLDGSQVLLESVDPNLALKLGQKHTFNFLIRSLPTTLPTGQYYLLSEVVDATGATSLTASSQTIAVVAPLIDPVVTLASVVPTTIKPNGIGSVLITVSNEGNISAGVLELRLSFSTDGITAVGSPLRTMKIALTVPTGRSVRFKLAFRVPRTTAAGMYFPIVSATLDGVAAAVASSSSAMTVS